MKRNWCSYSGVICLTGMLLYCCPVNVWFLLPLHCIGKKCLSVLLVIVILTPLPPLCFFSLHQSSYLRDGANAPIVPPHSSSAHSPFNTEHKSLPYGSRKYTHANHYSKDVGLGADVEESNANVNVDDSRRNLGDIVIPLSVAFSEVCETLYAGDLFD